MLDLLQCFWTVFHTLIVWTTLFVEGKVRDVDVIDSIYIIYYVQSSAGFKDSPAFFQSISPFVFTRCSCTPQAIIGFGPRRQRLFNCMNMVSMDIRGNTLTLQVTKMSSGTSQLFLLMRHQSVWAVDLPGFPAARRLWGLGLVGPTALNHWLW